MLWTLQDQHTDFDAHQNVEIFALMKLAKADLRTRVTNPTAYDRLADKLVAMQLASKIQKNNAISLTDLEGVENNKSGYSFPFYGCVVDFEPSENQFEVLYNFGVVLQYIDDILDVYEDCQSGIATMANTLPIVAFEAFFNAKVELFIAQLKQVGVSQNCMVHSCICFAVGIVQIQRIKNLCSDLVNADYKSMSRIQLICDMTKFENLWAHYAIVVRLTKKSKFG